MPDFEETQVEDALDAVGTAAEADVAESDEGETADSPGESIFAPPGRGEGKVPYRS